MTSCDHASAPPTTSGALRHIRICDFTGQLAGAGATKFLAAFGAEVIRIEDPVAKGRWDILRGSPPFPTGKRGLEAGSAFNNHNVEKLGITLNLRTERGRALLRELVKISDAVTENFSAGVLEGWGFGYDELCKLRRDIVYVSNCGFGRTGPYASYRSWGPIAQAMSGLTFSSGLPDHEPAGWGYSYMDHTGGYFMAIAILAALRHRERTGDGQWVDLSCTEAGATLVGPEVLDATVNDRPLRGPGLPHSNRNRSPAMAPHGIYPCSEDDTWVAIACRDDADWEQIAAAIAEPWCEESDRRTLLGRLGDEDRLDADLAGWTEQRQRAEVVARLRAAAVPVSPVQRPAERIDGDPHTLASGLWPTVQHPTIGSIRVDGLPVRFSETDWAIRRGAPCLGEHNDYVFGTLLGYDEDDRDQLRSEGVI